MLDAQDSGVGRLGCLRLHFVHFEKLGISHTFKLKLFDLLNSSNPTHPHSLIQPHSFNYSLGLMHDVCIMIFQ